MTKHDWFACIGEGDKCEHLQEYRRLIEDSARVIRSMKPPVCPENCEHRDEVLNAELEK